ncbi:S41 family peptidase [Clostridium cochlearium]|uniref:C-terminal processing peptidase-3. Serine peptidase. MEROPS family S41A n=1 Tax=Clostridium cochlearium TaxID=1494 RepID=A0A240AYN9_CLOCO|nr:S41 family peptidase [Clostridium cochlearium]MBV1818350.1 S41 family peptidase [Bacteroidales bacterium MSK.15.36]NSJ91554.1 S41 family peptidase [Coprococcus sp. MSK.21.13]MBE6065135.1 S41 family peptidase [Clostridium cochlearium]MBU5268511.1 S41 family peptidase [Clostridium cochlearium]MCG4570952.1 S41 family peptidase [Clostridium cochlearium]
MNKKKWIGWTIALLLITNTLTYLGSNIIPLAMPNGNVVVSKQDYNNLVQFNKLFQIKDIIYERYDGEINEKDLEEGAIKGLANSLKDPYTVFMTKKEYDDFNTQTEGNYSGVGIQVQAKNDKIIIVDIFEESPARKAGVLPKDEIEKVNDIPVSGSELDKAVSLMKGIEGTEVKLTLYRQDKGNFDVTLKRAKINLKTVAGQMIDENTALIQVTMFDENTAKNFKSELDKLKSQGMKGLILDLRGNPGGILDECVDMVSNFVPRGKTIVSTIDKYKSEQKYKSKGGNYVGLPLVVLTNEGSASASEIFVGAIRDYKIGTLVGEKTFGKGVVQTLYETGEGTALKITISKYYTPNGENIHKKGIKPDVEVKYPEELLKKPYSREEDPQFKKALEIVKEKI